MAIDWNAGVLIMMIIAQIVAFGFIATKLESRLTTLEIHIDYFREALRALGVNPPDHTYRPNRREGN